MDKQKKKLVDLLNSSDQDDLNETLDFKTVKKQPRRRLPRLKVNDSSGKKCQDDKKKRGNALKRSEMVKDKKQPSEMKESKQYPLRAVTQDKETDDVKKPKSSTIDEKKTRQQKKPKNKEGSDVDNVEFQINRDSKLGMSDGLVSREHDYNRLYVGLLDCSPSHKGKCALSPQKEKSVSPVFVSDNKDGCGAKIRTPSKSKRANKRLRSRSRDTSKHITRDSCDTVKGSTSDSQERDEEKMKTTDKKHPLIEVKRFNIMLKDCSPSKPSKSDSQMQGLCELNGFFL